MGGPKILVTYLRSSAIGTYALCPFQYFLAYGLGLYNRPNSKTERGSIVHKALELLACRKKAEQDGKAWFTEDETGLSYRAAGVSVRAAVEAAWAHYTTKNESGHDWSAADFDQCLAWTRDVVEFNGGMFSPLHRTVVCPERYFDLTIDEPWAGYHYTDPHTGKPVEGRLAIKGSVDLITEASPGVLELLDWKSGRRWNWAEDKPKEYADFLKDPQLLLYFYALTRLYPEYENVFVTIFYAQNREPFTVCYEKAVHVPYLLDLLRDRFDRFRRDVKPARIMADPRKSWKCKSFCHYGRTNWEGTKTSVCNHVHGQFVRLGLERTMKEFGKPNAYMNYGSGGGVSNRDTGESSNKT